MAILATAFLGVVPMATVLANTAPSAVSAPVATKSEPGAVKVFFDGLHDGAEVAKTFKVKFGINGMDVKPAGTMAKKTGHHHLIIDRDPIEAERIIPDDKNHRHFGKGQTETEVTLEPGKHRLILQFADGGHMSYGAQARAEIHVVVK